MSDEINDPPPVASNRLNAVSITDFVDEMMDTLPETLVLNMADHQQRNHLRSWMTRAFQDFLRKVVWDMQKGADRGIEQIGYLIEDPDYYRALQKRRKQERVTRARRNAESDALSQQWRQDQALALKEQIDAGKVSLLNMQWREDMMDSDTAWAIQMSGTPEHDVRCAAVPKPGALKGVTFRCNCGAVIIEWARRVAQQQKARLTERHAG